MEYIKKDMETVSKLYRFICDKESIKPIRITFHAKKQSGSCTYLARTKKPTAININLKTGCFGGAYILLHEVTHQILLETVQDATHGKRFKALEKKLQKAYLNCSIANEILF